MIELFVLLAVVAVGIGFYLDRKRKHRRQKVRETIGGDKDNDTDGGSDGGGG